MPFLAALGCAGLLGRPAIAGDTSAEQGDVSAVVAVIDRETARKWAEAKVEPAPAASDAEYLRRVYLDLVGKIPTVAEVRAFLDDPAPDKRARVVERLLGSPAYVSHFTRLWRDLIVPEADSDIQVRFMAVELEAWLRARIAANTGYDEVVRTMVALPAESNGQRAFKVFEARKEPVPAGFFFAKRGKPENLAAATARTFLGIRIECAQCHDHPFARWKRDEFWGLAAFFAGLDKTNEENDFAPIREVPDRRELLIPGTERVAAAQFLGGGEPAWKYKVSARQTLADWLTAPDNPYFARAAVNRYWAHFFGAGLVDPVDDMDDKTPSHPELLDELARRFAAHRFDTRFLIRALTSSRAYQLSGEGASASADPQLFARMNSKGLTPQQLFDSLARATGLDNGGTGPDPFLDRNARRAEFLRKFSRRDEKANDVQTSILQALALMNGKLVAEATDVDKGALIGAVAEAPFLDTPGRVDALFLATLGRPPRPDEKSRLVPYVDGGGPAKDPNKALGDVFWALLNSGEFLFNH